MPYTIEIHVLSSHCFTNLQVFFKRYCRVSFQSYFALHNHMDHSSYQSQVFKFYPRLSGLTQQKHLLFLSVCSWAGLQGSVGVSWGSWIWVLESSEDMLTHISGRWYWLLAETLVKNVDQNIYHWLQYVVCAS